MDDHKPNHEKWCRDNYSLVRRFAADDVVPLPNSSGVTCFFCKICEQLLKSVADVETHVSDSKHDMRKSNISDKTIEKFERENITISRVADGNEVLEFFCEYCDKSFRKVWEVENHIVNSDNHSKFKTGFRGLCEMLKHERVLAMRDRDLRFVQYYCLYCDRYFERKRDAGKHVDTDLHRKCRTDFTSIMEKYTYESVFTFDSPTGYRNFYCQSCVERLDSRYHVDEHLAISSHQESIKTKWLGLTDKLRNENIKTFTDSRGIWHYFCTACDQKLKSMFVAEGHIAGDDHYKHRRESNDAIKELQFENCTLILDKENGVYQYFCQFCDRYFPTKFEAKNHLDIESHEYFKNQHKATIDRLKSEKIFKFEDKGFTKFLCQACDEYFDSRRKAEEHITSDKHRQQNGYEYKDDGDSDKDYSPLDVNASPYSPAYPSPNSSPKKPLFPESPKRIKNDNASPFSKPPQQTQPSPQSQLSRPTQPSPPSQPLPTTKTVNASKRKTTEITIASDSEDELEQKKSKSNLTNLESDEKNRLKANEIKSEPQLNTENANQLTDESEPKPWFAVKCNTETERSQLELIVESIRTSIKFYTNRIVSLT